MTPDGAPVPEATGVVRAGTALRFPKEMCAMLGFYFPGDRELDCVNGLWPQTLAARE